MIVLLIGPSGSGKGTQAELAAKKLNLPAISMGQLMREEIQHNSALGQKIKNMYDRGLWIPAELTFAILKPTLEEHPEGFILDGFPRLVEQLYVLEDYLESKKKKIDLIIYLKVSDQEAIKRLLKRAEFDRQKTGQSRRDDSKEVIEQRLKSFNENTEPILRYAQEKGYLAEVDGERSIKKIHEDIMRRISE